MKDIVGLTRMTRVVPIFCVALLGAAIAGAQTVGMPPGVLVSATRQAIALDGLASRLTEAEVVFFGGHADDAAAYRVQLLALEALAKQRDDIVLAIEMLDREAQDPLDHFQMGHTAEHEFLAAARPGPRYQRDIKPIVERAIEREWPIVAIGASGAETTDDGTAELIAQAHAVGAMGGQRPLVIVMGALTPGIVEQTGRRLPGKRIATVKIASPSEAATEKAADYIVVIPTP